MADNIRPWYRWHVNRWRNSPRVLSMSLAAQGAYRNLLDAAWNNGAKLPNNPDVLWRFALASSSAEFSKIAPQIMPMFAVSDDGKWLLNETLTSEWNDATEWFKKKSAAGKLGADARWSQSNDMPVPSQSHGDAITVPMANDGTTPHHTTHQINTPKAQAPFVLPDDIPKEPWDGWIEMRKKNRKVPTVRAMNQAVVKLRDLRGKGHDSAKVLDQSTFNSWQDLYPLRELSNDKSRNGNGARDHPKEPGVFDWREDMKLHPENYVGAGDYLEGGKCNQK